MAGSECSQPPIAEQLHGRPSLSTFEWTSTDSLDVAVAEALAESLDLDEEEFVLQKSIEMDALTKLIGAEPGWATPRDALVSFRLEDHDCIVLVESGGKIHVLTPESCRAD